MNTNQTPSSSDNVDSAQQERVIADAVIGNTTQTNASADDSTTTAASKEKLEKAKMTEKIKNLFKVADNEKPNSFVAIFTTLLAVLSMLYYGITGIAYLVLALYAFLITSLGLAAATGLTVVACIFAVPVATRVLFAVTDCVGSFVYNTTNYVCNKFSALFARKPKVTVNVAAA